MGKNWGCGLMVVGLMMLLLYIFNILHKKVFSIVDSFVGKNIVDLVFYLWF